MQIVHSQRFPGGKVKQKIFRHVGSAPPGEALDALVELANRELKQARLQRSESLFPDFIEGTVVDTSRRKSKDEPLPILDARQLQGERTFCVGIHDVFGGLYDQLGLDSIWSKRHRVSTSVFRHMLLARLAVPGVSKLGYVDREAMYFGIEDLPVEKVYRMMDHLTPARCKQLRQHIQDLNRVILDTPPSAVLMDVTTLSFASEKDDELRKRGYSKDGKPHRVQVVLALIQSPQGLPIDYAVFPGNTGDVSTLKTLVNTLKNTGIRNTYGIQEVTAVMDAGMMSKDNLKALTDAKIQYVVAAKVGQFSLDELRAINDAPNWETIPPDPDNPPPDEPDRILDWHLRGRRLVLRL